MLGVLLAVLASAMNAAASVLQRKADRDESSFGWRMLLDVARRPAWWAGIGSVVLGFALQAVAPALSPVSVVQPLLISELPMTLLLASLVFRRLTVALTVAGRRTKNGRRAAFQSNSKRMRLRCGDARPRSGFSTPWPEAKWRCTDRNRSDELPQRKAFI